MSEIQPEEVNMPDALFVIQCRTCNTLLEMRESWETDDFEKTATVIAVDPCTTCAPEAEIIEGLYE